MQKTTLLTIFALSCLSAAAGPVYSCGNGSYTSEPKSSCAQAELPKISGHQGSGYHLNIRSLNASDERASAKPKKKARTGKSDKQEKKADKPSKNKNRAKAKKQQPMPSEQE